MVKSLKVFGWNNVGPSVADQWPSITSALGQCIVLSGVSDASIIQQSEKTVQSPNAVSTTVSKYTTDPVID